MSVRQAGLLGLLAALWGSSYLLIKYALAGFSPAEIVFLRSALAAVALGALMTVQGRGQAGVAWRELRRRPGTALLLGLLAVAAPFLLISFGELAVPSGLTAILIAPSPLFVAIAARRLDRSETVGARQALGLVVGLVGVGLLVGVESVHSVGALLGALAIVGAAASYALASFVVKGAYRGVPTGVITLCSILAATLLTLPPAAATAHHSIPGAGAIAAIVGLGVLNTAAAFLVFYKLIAELGAGRASLVSYLTPPFALAYGASLQGERITVSTIVGLALILGGVAAASISGSRTAARSPASVPRPGG